MNKSQRIHLNIDNPNTDKYIKTKLEQNVNTLEFLSMSIDTNEVYRDFNADYGVLVGRVVANGGIGIPNARISIFIPLTDDDAENGQIASIYPYKTPRDKNSDGKRYNLLPRVARIDPTTGVSIPKQPFGSFPIKEEIVTNTEFLDVYKKYYKYTALTNNSGDYMIFGVPIGTQTVHLSVDITDIGKYSMTPAAMVTNLGYSPNLFTDNNSKIKPSNDLGDLPHIETQEITVDIIPFWGDTTNFEIGISRQDFRIRSVLQNTFVIFGTVFTDPYKAQWGKVKTNDKCDVWTLYTMTDGDSTDTYESMSALHKRPGKVIEKIYYYPDNVTDAEIAAGTAVDKMLVLDPTEYSVYKQNGDFVVIINCNRKKVVMNEQGDLLPANSSSQIGLFTEFKGFITLEIDNELLPLDWTKHGEHVYLKPIRHKLKFPQCASCGHTFRNPVISGAEVDNDAWRKQYYTFSGGGIYSVAQFYGVIYNNYCADAESGKAGGFINGDNFNDIGTTTTWMNQQTGLILTNDFTMTGNSNTLCCFPNNTWITASNGEPFCGFGGNWMNMSIYLPQTGWAYDNYSYIYCWRSHSQFTYARKNDTYYMNDNQQMIAGTYMNTCSFARSDINWTDIIKVTKTDVLCMNSKSDKGFKTYTDGKTIDVLSGTYILQGTYRNATYVPPNWSAAVPFCGGKCNMCPTCSTDNRTYLYKGIDTSNTVAYLVSLGIV
jgi:hypothetical protein